MKLAVNYSTPLVSLLEAGRVRVDLIKCPDWDGMIREARPHGPLTLHFDLEVGLGNTFKADFARISDLLDSTETPHVNTHLVTPRTFDPDSPTELAQINRLWREELMLMVEALGAERVALEHFPYTEATPHILPATDSRIFSQVIEDMGCMFLLDVAHACITADSLGIDPKDYIRSLPVDRLVEMHTTGIRPHAGVLTDHFPLGERDWAMLAWALGEIRAGRWRKPAIVAYEYGGVGESFIWRTSGEAIETQVPRLYEMIHAG